MKSDHCLFHTSQPLNWLAQIDGAIYVLRSCAGVSIAPRSGQSVRRGGDRTGLMCMYNGWNPESKREASSQSAFCVGLDRVSRKHRRRKVLFGLNFTRLRVVASLP